MDSRNFIEVSKEVKKKIDNLLGETGGNVSQFIDDLIEKSKKYEIETHGCATRCNVYRNGQLDTYTIADSVSDGIYVTDKNGIVVSINKSFMKITAIEEHEIIGKSMEMIWKEKGHNKVDHAFFVMEAESNLDLLSMMNKNIQKNNTFRKPLPISSMVLDQKKKISVITTTAFTNKTVMIVGTPFFNEQGEISHILTILRDLTELIQLKERIDEAEREKKKYYDELRYLKENELLSNLIGVSDGMQRVKKLIGSVSKTDATVLITGATGVGKEVVAREIFKNSKRANGPYIKINCAAIPETLLESELFGYENGAFTGAQQKEKKGLFEMANKGTILLDEIGEMPLQLQAKILRVLQEKEIRRVGGTGYIRIDVRVIAATNQNLQEQVKERKFREDLYYRLNVIPIEIPSLGKRKEDIMILADSFLKKFNLKHDKNKYFERSAADILEAYEWPGNIRELENLIERLVVVGEDNQISRDDIIAILGKDKIQFHGINREKKTLKEAVNELEKRMIEETLRKHGSTYKAAEILGTAQSTILRKARALGIKTW